MYKAYTRYDGFTTGSVYTYRSGAQLVQIVDGPKIYITADGKQSWAV